MSKVRSILTIIFIVFFLQACSKLLEPVAIDSDLGRNATTAQEEFNINIKTLTFENARKANKAPYSRKIMFTGSGASANVINESNFLNAEIPRNATDDNYILGFKDEISLEILNEYAEEKILWPSKSEPQEYLLGIGDELSFIWSEENKDISDKIKNINSDKEYIATSGIIGSNGNVLLLSIGNLRASGRSLDDIRTEVRNILIRNGLTPNFQLEISSFQSKKAYVTNSLGENKTVEINNIPISLKEVALSFGLSEADGNTALITLVRNKKEYRLTANQLFNLKSLEIFIQDKDQIEIEIFQQSSTKINAIVGSTGYVILPGLAKINVSNYTLTNLRKKINEILTQKGQNPNFQLEIINYKNKKAYFIQKNVGSSILNLTGNPITLREVILQNSQVTSLSDGLTLITLKRRNKVYNLPLNVVLDPDTVKILVQGEDQIEVNHLKYKPGQVYALSGAGNASILPIKPSVRETLANVLFAPNGAFSNLSAKRSEVYLLRGQSPAVAYHLDAQNVSRILVAANMELRPSDIIYVADRPIISFTRVLSEITPLRTLLRDINDGNIP